MSLISGANTKIVSLLRDYGPVPKGFLANLLGRRPEELDSDLEDLRSKGVLKIDGDKVQLVSE
jgi:predicted transcriptional regulator